MAVNRVAKVDVKGAAELRRALRKMGDRQLMRELGALHQDVARYVVRRSQDRAARQGRQAARAAREVLKPMRTPSAARVLLENTRKVPYALGAEFGAKHDQPRRIQPRPTVARTDAEFTEAPARTMLGWNQFRPWAGNAFTSEGKGGYFLFPTIRAERDSIIDTYVDSINEFIDKTIPDGPRR